LGHWIGRRFIAEDVFRFWRSELRFGLCMAGCKPIW
jgi:hypothetical protein